MSRPSDNQIPDEVWTLLEALCEERLSAAQAKRLEKLVLSDKHIRRLYVEYITLHGNLHWDAALHAEGVPSTSDRDEIEPASEPPMSRLKRSPWLGWVLTAAAACLLVTLGALAQREFFGNPDSDRINDVAGGEGIRSGDNPDNSTTKRQSPANRERRQPIVIDDDNRNAAREQPDNGGKNRKPKVAKHNVPFVNVPPGGSSLEKVVAYVDAKLHENWTLEGVQPSELADDGKWVRRVYLDLIGRIPTVAEVDRFLQDDDANKRRKLIDKLLDEPRYVRHWATVWSNLLVGRKPSRNVNRPALEKFLRDSLHQNRPWKEIVVDFIAAEGPVEENGAANFLVAHLNNQAVPATAVTARLFLGMQVQCTQCHNHPFNDATQNQFWELNSFFKQTAIERKRSKSGQRPKVQLVNKPVGGFTYFPQRNEVMRVAVPKFGGTKLPLDPKVNRRKELARLLFEDENRQVARALINRLWSHFFGYGFTRPVDDMGPHNPPSHPELLDRLTGEFIASGYDLKRLIRWICNSRAYQLTSRFNDTNSFDDPAKGHMPLFSRMYVKPMTVEQLYDSLLVATKADAVGKKDWESISRRRQKWLQQFIHAYQTEENDEASTFDGTIPQALAMMNSELVQNAVSNQPGTVFHEVAAAKAKETSKIRTLALAALSREPTEKELAAFRKLLRTRPPRGVSRNAKQAQVLQDIFWAYLNSNEFILIH